MLGLSLLLQSLGYSSTPASVSLASSQNPAPLGHPVTFTATVSAGATGSVIFYDGFTGLGTATLSGGSAVLTVAALLSGTRSIHARYMGDATHGPAVSGTLAQIVNASVINGFLPAAGYAVNGGAGTVLRGDFNGDGRLDLATVGAGVSVLLGNGDGTFSPALNSAAGLFAYNAVAGDFNNDGKLDLAVLAVNPGVYVLLGNGDGTFRNPVAVSTNTYNNLLVADFNGDGYQDLAALSAQVGGGAPTLFPGKGDGSFQAPITLSTGEVFYSMAVADMNLDGTPDLVAITESESTTTQAEVFLGNGDGTFQGGVSGPATSYAAAFTVGDFNGDGLPDVALITARDNIVQPGDGHGGLLPGIQSTPTPFNGPFVLAGDFKGDGRLGLAGFYTNRIYLLFGNGDGTFSAGLTASTEAAPSWMVQGDFNGDGKPDFATVDTSSSTVNVFLGAQLSTVVPVTIQTAPEGMQVSVDGLDPFIAPQTLDLPAGSHTLSATDRETVYTTRHLFTSWSDGNLSSMDSITVGNTPASYTANFKTQYLLTLTGNTGGGSVSPSSNYYDAGTAVPITATPYTGWSFSFWTGDVVSLMNPATIIMDAPHSVTANFSYSCPELSAVSASLPATGTATPRACPDGSQVSCGYYPESPASFTVTPGGACSSWTATSSDPSFVRIISGASGSGPGAVTFTMLTNPHTTPRSAVITVTSGNPSASYLVTQAGNSDNIVYREVYALYEQLLGRDPDQNGFAFWVGVSTVGLGQMADDFLTSSEAFGTEFAVMAAYQAALGAPPSYAQFSASLPALRAGTQSVGGLFTSLLPAGYTAANLYQNLLGRQPTAAETASANAAGLASWSQTLIGYPNSISPVSAANSEFQSTGTFHTDHTNGLYVRMLYYVILSRDPDQDGFNFWLGIANGGSPGLLFQGNAGMSARLSILGLGTPNEGLIGSPEFQGLFAN